VWTQTIYDILKNRRGTNIQIGIGGFLPYGGKVVRSKAVLNVIADTRLACEDGLNALVSEHRS
jgi:hypothetical protein